MPPETSGGYFVSPPPPPPPVHTVVSLNYSALTTPVFHFKQSSDHRKRSYDVHHVDQREKRGKQRHVKLLKNYKKKLCDYKELLKKSKRQEEEIKQLRVQLAKSKVVVAKKITQNRRNLKRLANVRSTVKSKVTYVSKTTQDHLQLMQQNLAEENVKGKKLSEDFKQMVEEYCQLEEKTQEAQAQLDDLLEGSKQYVPSTMEGNKFTNEIRANLS